jgi:hypothetical protein
MNETITPVQTENRQRTLPDRGRKSPRYGHLGMWNFSLGPNSPVPGPRLIVLILDQHGQVVRRLEQIRGNCLDEGYVDFFLSHNCRPAAHEYPLVDIDANGQIGELLHPNFTPGTSMDIYLSILEKWASRWGKPEYSL